jgi:HAD superfamily hydrolase (TIGR01484 family)
MTVLNPQSITKAPLEELSSIKGVCFDIDDTFSSDGKILGSTFESLWKLKEAGFKLIPVTGRPAGWCDHIVRFWPVDAVVGENGAFVFYMNEGKRDRYDILSLEQLKENTKSLKQLEKKILKEFPHAKWASDQSYREFDLAIDFCEDVPAWDPSDIEKLVQLCRDDGAIAKVSSIHVNTWYGIYDKQSTFDRWIHDVGESYLGMSFHKSEWIYIGDSPNDEPAFEYFEKSVGVANLKDFFSQLKTLPTWVCDFESGKGFEQMVNLLISSQNY